MLSRGQQILLKRAQRQAGIDDAEYRETLEQFTGCRSSKDSRLGDDHLDVILSYFEAIYWRGVDAGRFKEPLKGDEPFQQRGYWASKNPRAETSRDRFNHSTLTIQIDALEAKMAGLGFGPGYCQAIRLKVTKGRTDARSINQYRAALNRTILAKRKTAVEQPF